MIAVTLHGDELELLPFPEMVEASQWFAANDCPTLASLLWREGDDLSDEEELQTELQSAEPPLQTPARFVVDQLKSGPEAAGSVKVATSEGIVVAKFKPYHVPGGSSAGGQFAEGGGGGGGGLSPQIKYAVDAGEKMRGILGEYEIETRWGGEIVKTPSDHGSHGYYTGKIHLRPSTLRTIHGIQGMTADKWESLGKEERTDIANSVRTLTHEVLHGVGNSTAIYQRQWRLVENVLDAGADHFAPLLFRRMTGVTPSNFPGKRFPTGIPYRGRLIPVSREHIQGLLRRPAILWKSQLDTWWSEI